VGKDSLWSIARQYYGAATHANVQAILEANPDLLSGPDAKLRVGMVLKIP
jgi:nucleoid-associated protein YgaU